MQFRKLFSVFAVFAVLATITAVPVASVLAQHKHNAAPSKPAVVFSDEAPKLTAEQENIQHLGYAASKPFSLSAMVASAVEERVRVNYGYASDSEIRFYREHAVYQTVMKLNLDKSLGPNSIRAVTYPTYGGQSNLAGKHVQLEIVKHTPMVTHCGGPRQTPDLPIVYQVISIKPLS